MIRLAVENSPLEVAFAAFDAANVRLHSMYQTVDPTTDTRSAQQERLEAALETRRLWQKFHDLYVADSGGDEPTRPAA